MSAIKRLRAWAHRFSDDAQIRIESSGRNDAVQWRVIAVREGTVNYTIGTDWQGTLEQSATKLIAILTELGEEIPAA